MSDNFSETSTDLQYLFDNIYLNGAFNKLYDRRLQGPCIMPWKHPIYWIEKMIKWIENIPSCWMLVNYVNYYLYTCVYKCTRVVYNIAALIMTKFERQNYRLHIRPATLCLTQLRQRIQDQAKYSNFGK